MEKHSSTGGLSHDLSYLTASFPGVLFWPVREQAKLADGVTREHAASAEFCARFIRPPGNVGSIERINATSVGNLAFLALHAHPDHIKEYRRLYCECIASWKFQIEKKKKNNVVFYSMCVAFLVLAFVIFI